MSQIPPPPPPIGPERRPSGEDRWAPVARNLSAALASVLVIAALAIALVYVLQNVHL